MSSKKGFNLFRKKKSKNNYEKDVGVVEIPLCEGLEFGWNRKGNTYSGQESI